MTPIKVKITGKFDLGYLLELSDGRTGQLRAIEMDERLLVYHNYGRESELFGEVIEVYIMRENTQLNIAFVSSFSPTEREHREAENDLWRRKIKKMSPEEWVLYAEKRQKQGEVMRDKYLGQGGSPKNSD